MHTIVYNVNQKIQKIRFLDLMIQNFHILRWCNPNIVKNWGFDIKLYPSNFSFKLQLQFHTSNLKCINFDLKFLIRFWTLWFHLKILHQAYSYSLVMPIQLHLLTYSHKTLISNKLNIQCQTFNSKSKTDEQTNKKTNKQTNDRKKWAVNFS